MANAEKQSLIAREVMAAADQDRDVDMEDFPEADDDVWNFIHHYRNDKNPLYLQHES